MWRLLKHFYLALLLLSMGLLIPFNQAVADQSPQRPTTSTTRALAPVLLVNGGDTTEANQWYQAYMDTVFGVGNWDEYNLPEQGLPDPPELFLSVLGQYQGVLWHADSSGLDLLFSASEVLADYIRSAPGGSAPGKLVLVVPPISLLIPSLQGGLAAELGIDNYPAPYGVLSIPADKTALALISDLPDLSESIVVPSASGLQPLDGSEILYQMEYCMRCYDSYRPPYDPIVAVRQPDRETSFYAQSIVLGLPIHLYDQGDEALQTLMQYHMGFIPTSAYNSGAGIVQLSINNAGYVGNLFASPTMPSMVYPYPSYVENLFQGGIWVGARLPSGSVHVSTSSDHYSNYVDADENREFIPTEDALRVISNIPESENFHPDAIAPWQLECSFMDYMLVESGEHVPLGIKVLLRATSWNDYPINDGVVLEYKVINISGSDLHDMYFGFFNDTTVGNTLINDPYTYSTPGWNWFDDVNGGWRPGDYSDDPDIWMMWEHDDDGDDGWATSWIGCRFLSSSHSMTPEQGIAPVSYNAWMFRHGPTEDDTYWDDSTETMRPGRYQAMGNGDFDSGVTPENDFSVASDWCGLLSTGPVATLAAGDTLRATYVLLGGSDGWNLMRNSRRFAELEANGWLLNATSVPSEIPRGVSLASAVPNPFNPHTEISFSIDQPGFTRLEVYGIDGRLVAVLVDEMRQAGEHRVSWSGNGKDGNAVASGMYLYRLMAPGGARLVGHMTLLK